MGIFGAEAGAAGGAGGAATGGGKLLCGGGRVGKVTAVPHVLQLARRPAKCGGTEKARPHPPH